MGIGEPGIIESGIGEMIGNHIRHLWVRNDSYWSCMGPESVCPGMTVRNCRSRNCRDTPGSASRTQVHSRNQVQQWPPWRQQSFFAPLLNFRLCRYRGSHCRAHHHYTSPLSPPFTSPHSSVCGYYCQLQSAILPWTPLLSYLPPLDFPPLRYRGKPLSHSPYFTTAVAAFIGLWLILPLLPYLPSSSPPLPSSYAHHIGRPSPIVSPSVASIPC